MLALLALLFLLVPIAELAVIVKVAGAIGVPETLLLLVAISLTGAWLVKHEGLGLLRRTQDALQRGELPHRELIDGVLILFAGALMLTPGFLSDVLGIFLLFPPTRAVVRAIVYRRFKNRLVISTRTWGRAGDVYDVSGHERGGPAPPRPELDP